MIPIPVKHSISSHGQVHINCMYKLTCTTHTTQASQASTIPNHSETGGIEYFLPGAVLDFSHFTIFFLIWHHCCHYYYWFERYTVHVPSRETSKTHTTRQCSLLLPTMSAHHKVRLTFMTCVSWITVDDDDFMHEILYFPTHPSPRSHSLLWLVEICSENHIRHLQSSQQSHHNISWN